MLLLPPCLIRLFGCGVTSYHTSAVCHTQIAQHVAEDTLRVKVLDSGSGKQADTAQDLAASYDLVITTFQRLSLEKGLGKGSPLLKVDSLSACCMYPARFRFMLLCR